MVAIDYAKKAADVDGGWQARQVKRFRSLISDPAISRWTFRCGCSTMPGEAPLGGVVSVIAAPRAVSVPVTAVAARRSGMMPHDLMSASSRSIDILRWSNCPSIARARSRGDIHAQHSAGTTS